MHNIAITMPIAKQGIKPILAFNGPESAIPNNYIQGVSRKTFFVMIINPLKFELSL